MSPYVTATRSEESRRGRHPRLAADERAVGGYERLSSLQKEREKEKPPFGKKERAAAKG